MQKIIKGNLNSKKSRFISEKNPKRIKKKVKPQQKMRKKIIKKTRL